ncbi:MAG TPA: N-acetylmuramic acid 6-phosphate etherase [Planctomycetota bacterium]|nr:N-acetylmuramic acid 6-phosphate etherase [Planctomycetota bacterium]
MRSAPIPDLKSLTTEQSNPRSAQLDQLSVGEFLRVVNREDARVARAVAKALPQIERTINAVAPRLKRGGRLFYIGAGTSGRLGCLDASEMPPTYGVPHTLVQGIIAGGLPALTRSQEGAEDDGTAGIRDIKERKIGKRDAVIGLSVSGRARYVREALGEARKRGAFTACITCNRNSALVECADVAIVAETGPEVVTGSTRMKAGTAQKMILNMISTGCMVQLGRVKGNRMVDLQIKCEKLFERARNLVMEETGCDMGHASAALKACGGSVRKAIASVLGSSSRNGTRVAAKHQRAENARKRQRRAQR